MPKCIVPTDLDKKNKVIIALVFVVGLGAVMLSPQVARAGFFGPDYPNQGGTWTLPDVSDAEMAAIQAMNTQQTAQTGLEAGMAPVSIPVPQISTERLQEIYKQNPCLDPENQKPRETSGHTWIYGRESASDTMGECHSTYVRVPSEQRPDGLRIGVVTAHGDDGPYEGETNIPDLPGLYVFKSPRPGYCEREAEAGPSLCTSGELSKYTNGDHEPIANRTPDKVDSYTGFAITAEQRYGLDAMIGWGESGGVEILSNVQKSLDGLFAWGTACDDKKWINDVRSKHASKFHENVDMLDGMSQWPTNYPVVIMNGSRDKTTEPKYGQMCYEEAQKRGLTNVQFISLEGVGHSNRPRYGTYEQSKEKIQKAFRILLDKVIEQTKAKKSTEAAHVK